MFDLRNNNATFFLQSSPSTDSQIQCFFLKLPGPWTLSWIHVPSLQLKDREAGEGVLTYVSGSQALLWEKFYTGEKGPCVYRDRLTTLFTFTGAHVREAQGGVLEGTGTNPTPTPPAATNDIFTTAFNGV